MALITLQDAKEHLRVDHDLDDADILLKMEQASDIVIDYLKLPEGKWDLDAGGSGSSSSGSSGSSSGLAPWRVTAATLLVLGELYRNREAGSNPLSQGAMDLLHRTRDPALA